MEYTEGNCRRNLELNYFSIPVEEITFGIFLSGGGGRCMRSAEHTVLGDRRAREVPSTRPHLVWAPVVTVRVDGYEQRGGEW
jgi:hypothetical protein